jgi:hypothetical protein
LQLQRASERYCVLFLLARATAGLGAFLSLLRVLQYAGVTPKVIVGAAAEPPQYAAPGWSREGAMVPPCQPTGEDINAQETTGEYFEVEASRKAKEESDDSKGQ